MSQAYDILKDEDKRAAYDRHGMEGIKEGRGKGGNGGDIFSTFFGGGKSRNRNEQRKAKGMLKEMNITLEEAYAGGLKKFHHERYRIC